MVEVIIQAKTTLIDFLFLFYNGLMQLLNQIMFCLSGGSNPILGDVLVIAGTCFFGLSNVGEVSLKHWL